MSNPTFRQGPITYPIAADIEQFRLVAVNEEEKIVHAAATGGVIGAVTEKGRLAPEAAGAPELGVHYGPAVVKLETTDTIKAGAAVFAAADGKVASTGTVKVGVAKSGTKNNKTLTILKDLPHATASSEA